MLDVPRHAEMDKEVPPALERENQILASATDGGYSLALETLGDRLRWLRPGQAWVCDLDALEPAAFESRGQPRPDRLNFR
jgi:hypothetical protein